MREGASRRHPNRALTLTPLPEPARLRRHASCCSRRDIGNKARPLSQMGTMMGSGGVMKHPSVRELYRYWNAQRGLRAAPERSDSEPGAIRRALATFHLSKMSPQGMPPPGTRFARRYPVAQRSAGSRGAAFVNPNREVSPHDLVGATRECVGAAAGACGCNADGEVPDFGSPSRRCGTRPRPTRACSFLAPQDLPYWFGMNRLAWPRARTIRYLGHEDRQNVDPSETKGPATGGRIRRPHRYDAGQAQICIRACCDPIGLTRH
jgi:hypothetical protein